MTTVTLLGTTGGAGATTLCALAVHDLRQAPGAARVGGQASGGPAVAAHDVAALERRLGGPVTTVGGSGHELIDGGLATARDARAALDEGLLTLVSPATPLGELALERTLAELGADGADLRNRLYVVRCASHGPGRGTRTPGGVPGSFLDVPFDPLLARALPVGAVSGHLRRGTRRAVAEWQRVLRSVLV